MVRRDSVLCLDRPPARIPHAGPGDGPTGARRFVSPRAPVRDGPQGMPRIVARPVGRENAVGPPDATSIANERDSRNPPHPERTSCLTSGPAHPLPPPRTPKGVRSPDGGLLHGIEPPHDRGDAPRELHDTCRGGPVLRRQRLQLEQLRFGEQGRQRVVQLVLRRPRRRADGDCRRTRRSSRDDGSSSSLCRGAAPARSVPSADTSSAASTPGSSCVMMARACALSRAAPDASSPE